MSLQPKLWQSLPDAPGVYLMKASDGAVIYVGKALRLRHRVRSYFQRRGGPTPTIVQLMRYVADIDYIVTETEVEALILENNLIKAHQPRYNVKLKDDKRYPYLQVTVNEPFPRIQITRIAENDGTRYFRPVRSRPFHAPNDEAADQGFSYPHLQPAACGDRQPSPSLS